MADRGRIAGGAFWTAAGLGIWPYLAMLWLYGGRRPLYCTQWDPWPELVAMAPAALMFALSAVLRFDRRQALVMLILFAVWPAVFVGCSLAVGIGGETEFFSTRP